MVRAITTSTEMRIGWHQGEGHMSTVNEALAVVRLGIDMRREQRKYFRAVPGTREKAVALEMSLAAERAFDQAAAKLVAPGFDLGGSDDGR